MYLKRKEGKAKLKVDFKTESRCYALHARQKRLGQIKPKTCHPEVDESKYKWTSGAIKTVTMPSFILISLLYSLVCIYSMCVQLYYRDICHALCDPLADLSKIWMIGELVSFRHQSSCPPGLHW